MSRKWINILELNRDGKSIDWLLQLSFNMYKQGELTWAGLREIVLGCGYKGCTEQDGKLTVVC